MKTMLKILMFALILFGGIGTVNAFDLDVTVVTPTANQNITGSITADCGVNVSSSNMTLQYFSAGWQNVVAANTTAGTNFTFAVTETSVADGAYTVSCLVDSGGVNESRSDNVSSVGWDDTGPTISLYTPATAGKKGTPFTITATCLDADFSNEACSSLVYYQDAGFDCVTGCTMTAVGTAFSYTYTPDVYNPRNAWLQATDQHSQTTNTSTTSIDVKSKGSGGPPVLYGDATTTLGISVAEEAAKKRKAAGGGIVVILIMVAGYFYLMRQK